MSPPRPKTIDDYLNTVERMEPDLHPVDLTGAAASVAVSLRRIANAMAMQQLSAVSEICITDTVSSRAMHELRKRLIDEYLFVNGLPDVVKNT